MGGVKNQVIEDMENADMEPEMEPSPDDFPVSDPPSTVKEFSNLQAKLFIKTVNDFSGYVSDEFLDMFEINLIRYAINVANKAARDNAPESRWNRINNSKRYWAIVNYLEARR